MSCSRTQRSDAGEARARRHSVSSQALYHWTTALPFFLTEIFDLVYLHFALNAQRVHLCSELTATPWMLEPFGEVGANFSLQLSSLTYFAKIRNKKVITENQCEKHKKSSLVTD